MMKKTKIKLGDNFQRETNRMHLKRFFPFLKKEYRIINKADTKSEKVLKELFGDKEADLNKLKAVHEYQSI